MSQKTVYNTANPDTKSSRQFHFDEINHAQRLSELIQELDKFSKSVNNAIDIHPDDIKEVYLVLHYQRVATHFSAICLLADQAYQHQIEVLLRSLLELTFNIVSYYKHSELYEAMTEGSDDQRRKVLSNLLSLQEYKPTLTLAEQNKLRVIVASAENIDRSDIPVFVKAELAGLLNEYRTTYQLLSESVHSSLHSLVEDLETDETESHIVGINSNSTNDKNLHSLLLASAEYLVMGTEVMFKMYKRLSIFNEELQRLKNKLRNEWKHHVVKVPHRQKHI